MISNDIKYVGVNDHNIDLFEGQFVVENGMAYNSYVIIDDKIAVMDSVDAHFGDEWIDNIKSLLGKRSPDFLVVHHMEPDHSGSVQKFLSSFPDAKVVSSDKAFKMMANFFGCDYQSRRIVVKDNETLCLGKHTLKFVSAPMVHWPEVFVSYDMQDKVLFSADAFGKFGALDVNEDWACEARRYYFGIVGKYGVQVQALLKKVSVLDITTICPLHGPVLCDNLGYYLNLYNTWSSYVAENDGILIAYTSIYGNTKKAVDLLANLLKEKCAKKVSVVDLARSDMHEAVEDAFRYSHLVLATTTYNADIFPFMREFIDNLIERNYQNRKVAFIENGSWVPMATKVMKGMLYTCKNLTFLQNDVRIESALSDESTKQIYALADELLQE